jgi:tetratricopeptide (TPR) repeat protein
MSFRALRFWPALLCLLPLSAAAQDAGTQANSPPPSAAPAENGDAARDEMPMVMLVLRRPAGMPAAKKDDLNTALMEMLRATIRASGKYHAMTFAPDQPFVRRAMLEHQIAAADLVEPVRPETLRNVAHVVGARQILTFGATLDKTAMKTDLQYQDAVGLQDWRILSAEQVSVPTVVGKRRLKQNELVSLTTDAITSRMHIPSHLAENLHLADQVQYLDPGGKVKKSDAQNTTEPARTDPEGGRSYEGGTPILHPGTAAPTGSKAGKTEHDASRPSAPDRTGAAGSAPPARANSRSEPQGSRQNVPEAPLDNRNTGPAFSTDTTPDRVPPNAPPTTNPVPTDYEAMAARYRQAGDLANVIVALRRAINERPKDVGLRRQLIQAYQQRGLFDAALSETNRINRINPSEGSVHRLSGDTLMAKGDLAGALKEYQEAVKADPKDGLAKVALGDALLLDNQYTGAIDAYEEAEKTDPRSPLPHRRLARALAGRAASDPTQYAASLAQVKTARSLTPSGDIDTYLDDYTQLMRLMEGRMRDILEELQGAYQAKVQGKRMVDELKSATADMKTRAEAAADYLDKLPPAVGQDVTHAHYQQGAALALQAISLFGDYLEKGDANLADTFQGAMLDARREFSVASKRLNASRPTKD